jgi:NTE family protein
LNLYNFNRILSHAYAGFQTGFFYKSALLKFRMDFPYQFYIEPYASFDGWNYLNNDDLLNEVSSPVTPTILKRINREYGLHIGVPIQESFKGFFTFEGISTLDRYINGDIFISTDKLDELELYGFRTGLNLSSNTLNRRQYASSGRAIGVWADYFSITENFTPGSTSVRQEPVKISHDWVRFKAGAEQYFGTGWYRPGYVAELVLSNQPFFQNYFGTIINTPAFLPMQDSPTLILQNFRSFKYAAGGIRNVFTIRKNLDFRVEGYLFKPFEHIEQNENQEAEISESNNLLYFAGTAGFAFHSPIGPISLSVNYYDDNENKLGILLHAGFLLFNKHTFD